MTIPDTNEFPKESGAWSSVIKYKSPLDRNDVALRILCAQIADGRTRTRDAIYDAYEYADLFLEEAAKVSQ